MVINPFEQNECDNFEGALKAYGLMWFLTMIRVHPNISPKKVVKYLIIQRIQTTYTPALFDIISGFE